jgi:hypothetical protein
MDADKRWRSVFASKHVILPLLPAAGEAETLRDAGTCWEAGADGVFLDGQDHLEAVVRAFPDWWIGVRLRGVDPLAAMQAVSPRAGGLWVDEAMMDRREADTARKLQAKEKQATLTFAGVPLDGIDLADTAFRASCYLDVLTTSVGPDRLKALHATPRRANMAVAITGDDLDPRLPWVDCLLVPFGEGLAALVHKVRTLSGVTPARRLPHDAPGELFAGASRPWSEADEQLPYTWGQGSQKGVPFLGWSFREVAAKLSVEGEPATVLLHLLDGRSPLEFLPLCGFPTGAGYTVSLTTSASPIEEGFLSCLHLARGGTVRADEAIPAFMKREAARYGHMEPALRAMYGNLRDAKGDFDYIDYPVFDSGTMGLDFALLVQDGIWLWSRAAHSHK